MLEKLIAERRVAPVRIGGEERYIAAEDAGLYRDALGVPPPPGLPETFLEDHPDAMRALVRRYARTHGPFPTAQLAQRYGVDPAPALRELEAKGRWSAASCCPVGPSASGATPTCCAGSPRQPRPPCGARSRPADRDRARPLPAELAERRRPTGPPAPAPTACARRWCRCRAVALTPKVWEEDVLPRRLGAWSPAWLDELCTSGELVWIGAGARGPRRRSRRPLLPRGRPPRRPTARQREAGAGRGSHARGDPRAAPRRPLLLARSARRPRFPGRGAARGALGPRLERRGDQRRLRAAAGAAAALGAGARASGAPLRPAPLRRGGCGGAGALVADRAAVRGSSRAGREAARPGRADAGALRHRHRGDRARRGRPGGFSTLYAELGNLELLGTARRGYFVEGLGGAQFALPGAVERLRSLPEAAGAFQILAAGDPANPYGAALPWPKPPSGRRPARAPGAHVLLRDGEPLVYVERGGRSLLRLGELDDADLGAAMRALSDAVAAGRLPKLAVEKLDGEPVIGSGHEEALLDAGFSRGPRKLTASAG
jgi:ATP-dependent Lhr-like helicase